MSAVIAPPAVETDWAVDLLNRSGARQWINKDGEWMISIPRHQSRERVVMAVEELERDAGRQACILWVKRRE